MKILHIDYDDYYYYPENISRLDDFIVYANEHYNSFFKLTKLENENCTFPYFIKEDTKEVLVNIAGMKEITEEEVTVLCRQEYDNRLKQLVKKKCIDCIHYEENSDGDNLNGHRGKLSLDGECWGYEKNCKI